MKWKKNKPRSVRLRVTQGLRSKGRKVGFHQPESECAGRGFLLRCVLRRTERMATNGIRFTSKCPSNCPAI
jgi:hypothetical protein